MASVVDDASKQGGESKEMFGIYVKNPKNVTVAGALRKFKERVQPSRDTTVYLIEGIRKWISTEKRPVTDERTEEEFVKYVWGHMRQCQRDNRAQHKMKSELRLRADKLKSSIVLPSPPASQHKNMAREIVELAQMFKEGLLTTDEFKKMKGGLLK